MASLLSRIAFVSWCASMLMTTLGGIACAQALKSTNGASSRGLMIAPCVANPSGLIDLQGRLGRASGSSSVEIFAASPVAEYYVSMIEQQYGSPARQQPTVSSIAELEDLERTVNKVPAVLAASHTARLVDGAFSCIGFAPGRYILLAQVAGSGAQASDPPAGVSFYRADVDVSSLRRHSIVVVNGFRRIGAYPPNG